MTVTMKFVICVSLFLGCTHALLLNTRANLCQECNDNDPANLCSSSNQYVVCKQPNPFCMDIYQNHNGQIKVVKRCASKSDCHNYWWLKTSTNPACSPSQLSSGNLATGVTCSVCCTSPHCNNRKYPVDVLIFPDTPANLCQVCNDNDPANLCSSSNQFVVCKQPNSFCMDIFHSHNGQLKVVKRCASKSDCHNYWWLKTSTNPACSPSQLSSGNLATGVTCSVCCTSPHCNNRKYPVDVLIFPDTPVTPNQTTSAITTGDEQDEDTG